MPEIAQRSFAAGEVSPSLYGRSDLVPYTTGVRSLFNYFVLAEGGVANRMGTEYIATIKNSGQARLVPFIFSVSQAYVAEFGATYARLYSNGVLASEEVTSYAFADLAELAWTQSADVMTLVHNNYPVSELKRTAAAAFTFTQPVYNTGPFRDPNPDPTIFVYVNLAFGVVLISATESIFTADHVDGLFYVEEWELSAVIPWTPEEVIGSAGVYRRAEGKVYRNLASGTCGTVQPTHGFGTIADGVVLWEFIHDGRGVLKITAFVSGTAVTADVVKRIPTTCIGGSSVTSHTDLTGDGTTKTFSLGAVTEVDRFKYEVQFDGDIQDPATYEINAVTNNIIFYTAPADLIDIDVDELLQNNRTSFWAFGAWSVEYGYPSEVDFYSDRLIFSASIDQPQTLWMTETSNYDKFGITVPMVESDAITKTINAREINGIRELVPLDDLHILTAGEEWYMTLGQDEIVAEGKIGFKPLSRNGSLRLPALLIGDSALYVQEKGKKIRDLLEGLELSITARHLFKTLTIVDWTYQKEPYGLAWIVLSDGSLVSLTYLREHKVVGWARSLLPGGTVESICSIPEGTEDRVYVSVKRTIDGSTVRYLERLASREYADIVDAKFLDSLLTYDGRAPTGVTMTLTGSGWTVDDTLTLTASAATFVSGDVDNEVYLDYGEDTQLILVITAFTSDVIVSVNPVSDVPAALQNVAVTDWGLAKDEFTNLSHLEGEAVKALSDGNVVEGLTVSSATVTLPEPGVVVHIGLAYQSELETLDIEVPGQQSIRSRRKTIPLVGVLVQEARGIYAGTDRTHMKEYPARAYEDYERPPSLLTGLAEVYLSTSSKKDKRIVIQQNDPLPQTILSLIPEIELGESG